MKIYCFNGPFLLMMMKILLQTNQFLSNYSECDGDTELTVVVVGDKWVA